MDHAIALQTAVIASTTLSASIDSTQTIHLHMARLLTVSRAARLVGITRGAIQKKILDGELSSFEGMVRLDDLTRLYPHASVEDNSMLEKVERIIERSAYMARNRPHYTPDTQTLALRLTKLSDELAFAKLQVSDFNILIEKLKSRLAHSQQLGGPEQTFAAALRQWLDGEYAKMKREQPVTDKLLTRDNFLRVLAAQVRNRTSGHEFFTQGADSILESGLSAGLALSYGCSNGNCGKCKARLLSGEIKKIRQHDFVLTEADKYQNFFLMCSNTALTDIEIETHEAGSENEIPQQSIEAWVRKVEYANPDVAILNVKTPRTQRLRFLAGQSVKIRIRDLPQRQLTIASCPCDDMNLQFHIRSDENDAFAKYIFHDSRKGDIAEIEGPEGDFILRADSIRTAIFIAFDDMFAPIKSLVEHAMTLDGAESLHLFWITADESGRYLNNLCRAWTDAMDEFHYHPIDTRLDFSLGTTQTQMDDFLSDALADLRLGECDIYLAGSKNVVQHTLNYLHSRGVTDAHIRYISS